MVSEQLAGEVGCRRARLLARHFAGVGERQPPALLKPPFELSLPLVRQARRGFGYARGDSRLVEGGAKPGRQRPEPQPAAKVLHAYPGLRRDLSSLRLRPRRRWTRGSTRSQRARWPVMACPGAQRRSSSPEGGLGAATCSAACTCGGAGHSPGYGELRDPLAPPPALDDPETPRARRDDDNRLQQPDVAAQLPQLHARGGVREPVDQVQRQLSRRIPGSVVGSRVSCPLTVPPPPLAPPRSRPARSCSRDCRRPRL
jgi:hypothetical protein